MELFSLIVLACLNGCSAADVGYIKPFESLEACVEAAHRDQEDRKRYAWKRNSPVYLYECRSAQRTVKVP